MIAGHLKDARSFSGAPAFVASINATPAAKQGLTGGIAFFLEANIPQ